MFAQIQGSARIRLENGSTIRINYVNADLGDVIRSLAVVLGVNVVLTNVPNRRITFQTPEPVPAAQVGGVLEAILESQGLVLVQTGPVAQVLPEETKMTASSRIRAPEPKIRSVWSKSPSPNSPAQTASQNHCWRTSTRGP